MYSFIQSSPVFTRPRRPPSILCRIPLEHMIYSFYHIHLYIKLSHNCRSYWVTSVRDLEYTGLSLS